MDILHKGDDDDDNNNNNNRALEDFGFVVLFGLKIIIQMSSLMCILGSLFLLVDIS